MAWKLQHHLMLSWGKPSFAGDVQLLSTRAGNVSFSFHQQKLYFLLISMVWLRHNINLNAFYRFVHLTQGEESHIQSSAECQCCSFGREWRPDFFSHCIVEGGWVFSQFFCPLLCFPLSVEENGAAPRKLFSPP